MCSIIKVKAVKYLLYNNLKVCYAEYNKQYRPLANISKSDCKQRQKKHILPIDSCVKIFNLPFSPQLIGFSFLLLTQNIKVLHTAPILYMRLLY